MNTLLNDSNFLLYAASHYDSVFPDDQEFHDDLKRIIYLKRLFNIYQVKGELKERLILNHFIVLFNMWDRYLLPMLFLKLEGYEVILKTFLVFLNRMPEKICLDGRTVISCDIDIDKELLDKLKQLTQIT